MSARLSSGRGKVDIIPTREVQRTAGGQQLRNIRVRSIRVARSLDGFGEQLVTVALITYDGEAHAVALELDDALELADEIRAQCGFAKRARRPAPALLHDAPTQPKGTE